MGGTATHQLYELMVPQGVWMIEQFGKYILIAKPGLHTAIPVIDRIAYKRSLKESTIDIHHQQAITRDNVHVRLDGSVYTQCLQSKQWH